LEGWQKGRQEGELEGQQKGQISSLQAAVLRVLLTRFTDIPDSLRVALQQTQEIGTLDNYLQQAVICPDIGSFKLLGAGLKDRGPKSGNGGTMGTKRRRGARPRSSP
jgi:hypothetical protein